MHNRNSGCCCGCYGRRYLTEEEKKERLLHRQECLENELQGVREALAETSK